MKREGRPLGQGGPAHAGPIVKLPSGSRRNHCCSTIRLMGQRPAPWQLRLLCSWAPRLPVGGVLAEKLTKRGELRAPCSWVWIEAVFTRYFKRILGAFFGESAAPQQVLGQQLLIAGLLSFLGTAVQVAKEQITANHPTKIVYTSFRRLSAPPFMEAPPTRLVKAHAACLIE